MGLGRVSGPAPDNLSCEGLGRRGNLPAFFRAGQGMMPSHSSFAPNSTIRT
jgi:hypothetical protein